MDAPGRVGEKLPITVGRLLGEEKARIGDDGRKEGRLDEGSLDSSPSEGEKIFHAHSESISRAKAQRSPGTLFIRQLDRFPRALCKEYAGSWKYEEST